MAACALRVILIGKTGSGKSSLGNSLANTKAFKVGRGMNSETLDCKWHHSSGGPTVLEIVDTPGLCDTHLPEKLIYREVGKSVAVASPGPHLIILALRCDRRFTDEEFQAYVKLKELFSHEMTKYMIVVFNGMDELGDTIAEQKSALKDEVRKQPGKLQTVLRDCNHRFTGMNNKASGADKERLRNDLLFLMMETVRQNGNTYYTTRIITDLSSLMEGLIQSRANKQKLSRAQAELTVKRMIAEEEGDEGKHYAEQVQELVNHLITVTLSSYLCLLQ